MNMQLGIYIEGHGPVLFPTPLNDRADAIVTWIHQDKDGHHSPMKPKAGGDESSASTEEGGAKIDGWRSLEKAP